MRSDLQEHEAEQAGNDGWIAPPLQGIVAATTGLLAAILRAGSLVAMAVSSVPFWRRVDPLMILSLSDEEREDLEDSLREADSAEEDLEAMMEGESREGGTGERL